MGLFQSSLKNKPKYSESVSCLLNTILITDVTGIVSITFSPFDLSF